MLKYYSVIEKMLLQIIVCIIATLGLQPILRSTEYAYKISKGMVKSFRRISLTNTITVQFYILDFQKILQMTPSLQLSLTLRLTHVDLAGPMTCIS